ncbi:MAG: hypothetical protein ABIP75_02245 [Pyrinomonadaceae bacterium]
MAIEVWEALDCESVGRRELEDITTVIRDVFGDGAVESPVRLARLLADEGAELRHFEVLEYDVERRLDDPYVAMFRNLAKFTTLPEANTTLRNMEGLRRKFTAAQDREGLRRLLDLARRAKQRAQTTAANPRTGAKRKAECAEIAEWLTIWLNQPEIFDTWLELRQRSDEYRTNFAASGAA